MNVIGLGTIEYTPIHFMHQSVSFEELLALYAVSDACVVASTRDGMNLVSFEYIACQQQRHGAMILSEFAGSAQSLCGAIVVNPWDTDQMARAMHQAVTMSERERSERFWRMHGYVRTFTRYVLGPALDLNHHRFGRGTNNFYSAFWGESFVSALIKAGGEPERVVKLGRDLLPGRIDWRSYDGEAEVVD